MSLDAELTFDIIYARASKPKAFAVGPGGAWAYYYGASGTKSVAEFALEDCNKQLAANHDGACTLFASDDNILLPKATVGLRLNEAPPPWVTNLPISTRFSPPSAPGSPKAVVIFFSGCGACGDVKDAGAYADYFNAKGAIFIAANTPQAFRAAIPGPNRKSITEREFTAAFKSIVLQAEATVRDVHKAYPMLPVYLWGDGLGGYLAQLTGAQSDGLIITGSVCNAYNRTPPGVEVRYVYGDADPRLALLGAMPDAVSANRYCADAAPTYSSQIVMIAGLATTPLPSRPEFDSAVTELMSLTAHSTP